MRLTNRMILVLFVLGATGCQAKTVGRGCPGIRITQLSNERPRDKRSSLEFVRVTQDNAAVVRVGGVEATGRPGDELVTADGERQHVFVKSTDVLSQSVVLTMFGSGHTYKRWFIIASSTPVPFLPEF